MAKFIDTETNGVYSQIDSLNSPIDCINEGPDSIRAQAVNVDILIGQTDKLNNHTDCLDIRSQITR